MAAIEMAFDLFDKDVDPNACPIVLLHGFFYNKFMFKDLCENLSRVIKCKVYSLDLRNHGLSPVCKEVSGKLMAEDVKKFLQDKGLHKVNFICHSISSQVAYLVLLDQPEKVNKIVMIDCAPFYTEEELNTEILLTPQVISQNNLLKILEPKMSLAQAKSKLYSMADALDTSQKYFIKKAAYDLTKEKGEFKWKIDLDYLHQKYLEKHFIQKPRGSSNHEQLVLRPVNSMHISDEKFNGILKHNPRAKLVTFENASHALMFDRQEKFIEVVKEFLISPSDGLPTRRTV